MNWTICPICGSEASYIEGLCISMIDGSIVRQEDMGVPGTPGWAFVRENDTIYWPCGGYKIWLDPEGQVQTEHLRPAAAPSAPQGQLGELPEV